MLIFIRMETNRRRIQRRLEREGWYLTDTAQAMTSTGIRALTVPRHLILSTGMARTIAQNRRDAMIRYPALRTAPREPMAEMACHTVDEALLNAEDVLLRD